jgi:hypothetical protein
MILLHIEAYFVLLEYIYICCKKQELLSFARIWVHPGFWWVRVAELLGFFYVVSLFFFACLFLFIYIYIYKLEQYFFNTFVADCMSCLAWAFI